MNRDKPLSNLRKNYQASELREANAHKNPFIQFKDWFDCAQNSGLHEPNAMSLATVDGRGRVSNRMVLLKAFDQQGFVFYTNYESRKAQALEQNGQAALCFWWDVLERQIRIEGKVERVSADQSNEYFASRPYGSRIGAIASKQSAVLPNYELLEQQYEDVSQQYPKSGRVPRPAYWGGYRVVPQAIEFWQGRPSRLHDRLRYSRSDDKTWKIERLSP